jgi:hypothetical protein
MTTLSTIVSRIDTILAVATGESNAAVTIRLPYTITSPAGKATDAVLRFRLNHPVTLATLETYLSGLKVRVNVTRPKVSDGIISIGIRDQMTGPELVSVIVAIRKLWADLSTITADVDASKAGKGKGKGKDKPAADTTLTAAANAAV